VGSLDGDGVAVLLGQRADGLDVGDGFGDARHGWYALGFGRPPRGDLVAHQLDRSWWGTDPDLPRLFHRPSEVGVLGEEPVAGMNGVCVRLPSDPQNGFLVQIGLRSRCRTDVPGFVGEGDMESVSIELRIDGDRVDAHVAGGANHPN